MNFVFTAMDQNLEELPELVRLAGEVGMDEVKAVYLTAFEEGMASQTLYDKMEKTRTVFQKAIEVGKTCGVSLKLPHLVGEDPAGQQCHKKTMYGFIICNSGDIFQNSVEVCSTTDFLIGFNTCTIHAYGL